MTVGGAGGQLVFNMEFLRVKSTKGFTVADAFDGFLGLGNQAPASTIPSRSSVIYKMRDQGIISSKIFTISGGGTVLTFGDLPTLNPVNYVDIASKGKGKWDFKASLVTVDDGAGGIYTVAKNVVFRIQTIVPNIGLPTAALKSIANQLNAVQNAFTKLYVVNCAPTKNIILTINNQVYTIPQANYISNNNGLCTLNFFESSEWILGQTFLTAFNVVFDADANRIGIANP